jgi:hypothetical protein
MEVQACQSCCSATHTPRHRPAKRVSVSLRQYQHTPIAHTVPCSSLSQYSNMLGPCFAVSLQHTQAQHMQQNNTYSTQLLPASCTLLKPVPHQSPLVSFRGGSPVPRASRSILLPLPLPLALLLPLTTGLRGGTLSTASATSPNPAA